MPRTAKIAVGALAFLAIALTGLYAYLRWDNYNALRQLIASRVEEATGQQLSFNGPISLEMGADSFLRFRDVVLTNPDWQFLRSTITVDEGRIGLDVPNVVSGGIGTVVQLNTIKVTLDRPNSAREIPDAPAPGAALSAPAKPPLPAFDELRAQKLIVLGDAVLGKRMLQLEDLKVVPETDQRTRLEARAQGSDDVTLNVVTDEIENGRAWSIEITSPRSDITAALEATTGRKLFLRALAQGASLDLEDLNAILPPRGQAEAMAESSKAFIDPKADLPIGWLQLITANIDIRIGRVFGPTLDLYGVRLDGRADNGWISFAPLEARSLNGSARGFAILDASTLPASAEVSMQMRDFSPFKEDAATLDAGVSLTSRGRKFQQLYALNGAVRAYMDQGPQGSALFPQVFAPVFEVFEGGGSSAPTFRTQCGVFNLALNNGRSEALSAQVFGPDGRVAVRGKVDFMKALVDLDFAAQPVDGEVQYLDAVGSFASPAVSPGARQAPWLTLANTKDKMCEVLRQQSQAALDG
jgi:uncharacterized protein involved in outer membrane biogenesis